MGSFLSPTSFSGCFCSITKGLNSTVGFDFSSSTIDFSFSFSGFLQLFAHSGSTYHGRKQECPQNNRPFEGITHLFQDEVLVLFLVLQE